MSTITSWRTNVKNLGDYFKSDYYPTEEDKHLHNRKAKAWQQLTLAEFDVFLSISIAIQCVKGRRLQDFWTVCNPLYGNEWISSKMGRDRFEQILQHFHFNVDLFTSRIKELCQKNWIPYQKVTFDETILPFLGRFYASVRK